MPLVQCRQGMSLGARATSLESQLLEARERHIQETEAHSAQVAELEGELKEAQAELAKWMQQQQALHREQAEVNALQRECQQLQERLRDAEATSQVLPVPWVLGVASAMARPLCSTHTCGAAKHPCRLLCMRHGLMCAGA